MLTLDTGDLFNLLHKKLDIHLSMIQRLRMARHAALSIAFLHQNHVMHRDIKSMNFLVCQTSTETLNFLTLVGDRRLQL